MGNIVIEIYESPFLKGFFLCCSFSEKTGSNCHCIFAQKENDLIRPLLALKIRYATVNL